MYAAPIWRRSWPSTAVALALWQAEVSAPIVPPVALSCERAMLLSSLLYPQSSQLVNWGLPSAAIEGASPQKKVCVPRWRELWQDRERQTGIGIADAESIGCRRKGNAAGRLARETARQKGIGSRPALPAAKRARLVKRSAPSHLHARPHPQNQAIASSLGWQNWRSPACHAPASTRSPCRGSYMSAKGTCWPRHDSLRTASATSMEASEMCDPASRPRRKRGERSGNSFGLKLIGAL